MGASKTFTFNIKAVANMNDVLTNINNIQTALNKLKLPDSMKASFDKTFKNLTREVENYQTILNKPNKTKGDITGLEKSSARIITLYDQIAQKVKSIDNSTLKNAFKDLGAQQVRELKEQVTSLQNDLAGLAKSSEFAKGLKSGFEQLKEDTKGASTEVQALIKKLESSTFGKTLFKNIDIGRLDLVKNNIDTIKQKIEEFKQTTKQEPPEALTKWLTDLENKFKELGENEAIQKTVTKLNELKQNLSGSEAKIIEGLVQGFRDGTIAVDQFGNVIVKTTGDMNALNKSQQQFNDEIGQVKSRVKYLLGLNNVINLVRRGIRSAFNTIKELDKAMTETAVVTNMTVSDMWAKLPEYTKRANQLGVSTLEAYQAATLYYQQGLNDTQAAELSTETLKMARIAGLEAADATDRMTNALRGFNMELNAVNAQKVDDVYSKLAAMSASNVDEISTAMTKVASLAHNANMDFETTAAFLAQIIETTRESAETAGTALKTVVARFSEVKKLVTEDQLKGQDEEGQIIDVNKVSAALRTAGIDLNKYFTGEVGLDDIFMELASKWDSLTSVQQRYIATQAAGSRQQSRFIAMMQDYARTQELVSAAYNANGASAEQFEKTQESLQTKLAQLTNAWNEFLMGITNSSLIKVAVSALTLLLNFVNQLTTGFGILTGSVGSFISGLLKLSAAVLALKGLRTIFKTGGVASKLFAGFSGSGIGKFLGFGTALETSAATAGASLKTGGAVGAEKLVAGASRAAIILAQGAAGKIPIRGKIGTEGAYKKVPAPTGEVANYGLTGGIGLLGRIGDSGLAKANSNFGLGKILKNKFVGGKLATKAGTIATAAGASEAGIAAAGGAVASGMALIATLGVVAAAAGIAYLAIRKLWYEKTPAYQLKVAKKYAEALKKVSENAKKVASEMKEAKSKTEDYEKQISEATNRADRQKLIQEQNEYIVGLMEQDERYAKYVKTSFEGGQLRLTIDQKEFSTAVEEVENAAARASAIANLANADVQEKQVTALEGRKLKNVDLENRTYTGTQIVGTGRGATTREVTMTMSDRQYAQQLAIQAQIDAAEASARAYRTMAISQYANTYSGQASGEVLGLISNVLAGHMDWSAIDSEVETRRQQLVFASDAAMEDRYYQLYGVKLEKGYDKDEAKRQIAYGEVLQEQLDQYIPGFINIAKDANGEAILQILAGTYEGSQEDAEKAVEEVLKNEEYKEALVKLLGVDEKDLKDELNNRYKKIQAEDKARRERIYKKSFTAGMPLNEEQIKWVEGLDPGQARQIEAITSKASELLSTKAYKELFENLRKDNKEYLDKVQNFLNNIDLSNPINAYLQLKEAVNSSDEAVQSLANDILKTNQDKLNPFSLVTDFINSGAYDALSESLSKFVDENGEITSSNILELAKSNETLNNLLKTGVITTKALSVALTALEKGKISVDQLSTSVIAALNAMDDLDGVVERTIDDLNNFNPGYDENDITKFISTAYDFSKEQIGKGAYGNNKMNAYMEKIFGKFDPTKEEYAGMSYESAQQAWLQKNLAWLEANKENMQSAWHNILGGASEKAFSEGVRIIEKDGKIFIDAAGHTTDQLVKILTKATGLTEQQIRMMIADFKNYSSDFAFALESADVDNVLNEWIKKLPKVGNQVLYLKKELEALAAALGYSPEELQKKLDVLLGKRGLRASGYTDQQKYIKEALGNEKYYKSKGTVDTPMAGAPLSNILIGKFTKEKEVDLIDYDKLKKKMADAGLPEYFEETLNKMAEKDGYFMARIGGDLKKIKIKAGETASEAYQRAVQEAADQSFADKIGKAVAESLKDIKVNLNTGEAEQKVNDLLEKIPSEIEIPVLLSGIDEAIAQAKILSAILGGITFGSGGSGSNNNQGIGPIKDRRPGASGGIVGSNAKGTNSHKLSPGTSLTGEEAPEIVWNKEKGYAYITGAHGPQFQNLKPGDQVFNGEETKKILDNSFSQQQIFGSHANEKHHGPVFDYETLGVPSPSAYTKKTNNENSNNNNNNNKRDWKNDLDWLYDLMEDIAEEEHRQSLLQEEYDLSLKDLNKTGKDLYDLTKQELSSLMTQLDAQQFAYEKRLQQMNELQAEVNEKGYQEYIQWNPNDQTLEIDWDKIEDLTDKDTYEAIKDLLSEMEKVQGQMDDAEKSIWDIKKQIQEIQTRYLEKYLDFQQKVLDAVVKSYQDNIDELNSLNDTIKEANDSILDSIQKEIDLQRQIRDNTKTESDIYDMEARLAYLLRDTSGANQKEIQDLQKQLKESRENYADTLIDQSIKRLQDSNSNAADQREQQIKLLEAQLEYWQETGALWLEVAQLIADGFTAQGSIIEGSTLWEFLKRADSWDGLSEAQKKNWANELILEANEVGAHLIQLSGGMDIDTDKVINSIADINGVLTEDISVKLEQVRAILAEIGTLGGTPEHSNHEGYYASGGLNTHPGPAILHGTSTEPEYVLNARQTGAFLRLADVLPSIFGSGTGTTNNYGTNVYVELNMSVGEIGSDYDVDRLVARVKDDIYDASSYRNVNAVSFLR